MIRKTVPMFGSSPSAGFFRIVLQPVDSADDFAHLTPQTFGTG